MSMQCFLKCSLKNFSYCSFLEVILPSSTPTSTTTSTWVEISINLVKSSTHPPTQPGWDKIFHFVGANTFSQKFRPKQRESDATKDSKTAIIWVFLPVTRNVFLWQDISASDKKFHTVTRNFFLWQEISNYGMKFLPVAKSFFLW